MRTHNPLWPSVSFQTLFVILMFHHHKSLCHCFVSLPPPRPFRVILYLKQKVCDTFVPTACGQHEGCESFGGGGIYIHTGLQQQICNVVVTNVGRIHKWGPSSNVLTIQVHFTPESTHSYVNKLWNILARVEILVLRGPHFLMHSATTSYWPMEQAVWRSRGTSSSSARSRESPSHRERLAPSCSDSLASSLNSDIFTLFSWETETP